LYLKKKSENYVNSKHLDKNFITLLKYFPTDVKNYKNLINNQEISNYNEILEKNLKDISILYVNKTKKLSKKFKYFKYLIFQKKKLFLKNKKINNYTFINVSSNKSLIFNKNSVFIKNLIININSNSLFYNQIFIYLNCILKKFIKV